MTQVYYLEFLPHEYSLHALDFYKIFLNGYKYITLNVDINLFPGGSMWKYLIETGCFTTFS